MPQETECPLCAIASTESYRIIAETTYSVSVICQETLKYGHLLILPKRHVLQQTPGALTAAEAHDLMCLFEEMEHLLQQTCESDDSIFLGKNSGINSSQPHLHFHMIPSKASIRKLFGVYESIDPNPEHPYEFYTEMKERIIAQKNNNPLV